MQKVFSLILLLLYMCTSSFAAGDGALIRDIKACISFEKDHTSHLNIEWDGSSTEVKIFYKATETNETSMKYESEPKKMIIGLKLENVSIGSNLTVQVAPAYTNRTLRGNKSNPISLVVNYIHSVTWTRMSANHIRFNCSLACRSAVNGCVVELNRTVNRSSSIMKGDFYTWGQVDFYSLDADQAFSFSVYAQDRLKNILGKRINGSIPPLSTAADNTISPTTESEVTSTVVTLATSSLHVTTASSVSTKGNNMTTTTTTTTAATATPVNKPQVNDEEDKNNSSTGLMIGVIITSLLVVLLASILLMVGLFLWRQRKGRTSEVSSKHITDPKHDVENAQHIKDKNIIAINAYEEIVEIPVYSKPLSTSNPIFLQTGRVKHSSISSKKSVSSQKSFENLRGSLSPRVFDEKIDDNRNIETESSNKETHDHSSNEHVIDQCSGSNNIQTNFNSGNENSDQDSPAPTENDTEEKENPYFELVNLATTNCYENATILPLNKQTSNKDCKKENRDLEEKVSGKCQTLPIQGLRNSKSLPLDDSSNKRRSLNDYDEPVKVDQVIDPTTGHTYTLPILRKKE